MSDHIFKENYMHEKATLVNAPRQSAAMEVMQGLTALAEKSMFAAQRLSEKTSGFRYETPASPSECTKERDLPQYFNELRITEQRISENLDWILRVIDELDI
jgi:hypothetical protein